MKQLGYIATLFDLILGNSHYIYLLASASDEWYVSDVCQATRVVLWIAVALFWIRGSIAENVTIGWYGLCALWDVAQTMNKTNGTNPTTEIVIFMVGAFVIQLYFYANGYKKKGTNNY